MAAEFDVLVKNGLWFDGTGAPGLVRDLGITGGRVVEVAESLDAGPATEVVEADGKWVMPGFIDVHTHYDAEVLVAAGLNESVRHGVTTVLLGNCSLSTVYVTPLDAADLFSRVEALPRPQVLAALKEKKTWHNPTEYIDAIEALPLGPNIASMLGVTPTCAPPSWASAARPIRTSRRRRTRCSRWSGRCATPSTPGSSVCRR
jgi:N-acyl-D-aspartate/D-glutamate deacylase